MTTESNSGAGAWLGWGLAFGALLTTILIAMANSCEADKVCYPARSVTVVHHGDYFGAVCASPAGPVLKKKE